MNEAYRKSANIGGLSSYPKRYHTQITDFLNDAPDICREAWNDICNDFHTITGVEYKNKTGRRATGAFYSLYVDSVYLNITKASKGSSYQTPFQVVFYEFGHHMDSIFNRIHMVMEINKNHLMKHTKIVYLVRRKKKKHNKQFRLCCKQRIQ